VAEDRTLGELARNLADFKRDIRESLKNADDRHADLAGKMVPTSLWQAEHESLERDVAELRDDVRQAVERIERTSLERMGVLTEKIDKLDRRIGAHESAHRDSNAWSRSKTLTAIGIAVGAVATVAGAWIAAVLAAKGVH